jgi:transposase
MHESTTFVGLDVHKLEHAVALYLPGESQPRQWTVKNQPQEIARMVQRVRKIAPEPIVFAYEAGVCGFALQRLIQSHGAVCQVIAPALIPVRPGDRVATDRRDACKLGQLLGAGLLTPIHPPTEAQEAVRDLCRCREAAMLDLRRIRQQVNKFLMRRGYIFVEARNWTAKHLDWLGAMRLPLPLEQRVLENYLLEMEHRQQRLADLDQDLEAHAAQEPYRQPVQWLRCFRGINTLTALSLVAELYAIERFAHARQLMAYLGLTPSQASSGQTRRMGQITKAGNSRVRRLLIEAAHCQTPPVRPSKLLAARRQGQPAWVVQIAQRAQRRLHDRYWRLVNHGKTGNKAATAVARELAGFVWSVLRGPSLSGGVAAHLAAQDTRAPGRRCAATPGCQGGV